MLDRGILIHAQIVEDGLQLDASVANALIDMYSKCGNFGDAFKILEDLPARNVVSWTAIVANLSYQGFGQEAFRTFHEMQSEGVKPNEITYAGILRACAGAKAVGEGRLIHAHMVEQMIERDRACGSVVGNSLLDMYAKCRSLDDARNVFYCCLAEHDAASYSVMISMYAQHGSANGALQLFREMQSVGIRPNEATYVSILKLGSDVADLGHALSMHSQIIKHGFDADTWVCNSLLNMYIKCGSIDHAHQLFDLSGWRDVVAWSALIAGYAEHGHVVEAFALFERMQACGVEPNPITLIAILKACSASLALNRGKSVHEYAVKYGHESDICVANALVHLYTACRQLQDGMLIFESLPERDVVTWTVIIAAHIQHDCFEGALLLLSRMQQQGIEPNHATFISAFKSCCSPSAARLGKRLHSWVIEDGLDSDAPIANSVIHMYGNCGAVADSLAAFYVLRRRDVIAWSTMIALLSEQGECAEALRFYRDMLDDEGLEPNHITLLSVVRSCSGVERLEQGQIVHSQIAEAGLIQAEVAIGNALIDMYAKCGALGDARKVFGGMARRDVVSWTAVIEGHAQQQCSRDALAYFGQMLQLGIAPNRVTLLSVLGACCSIAAMQQGRVIHGHVIEQGFEHDPRLASALLDLYAKCSTRGDARNLFAGLKDRDAVAWSSMVAGHAQANDFGLAMEYFDGMLKHGLQPDDVAFLSLLSACSHVGLLSEGLRIIGLMIGDGLELSSEHYSCIVDLLGRTGQLDVARAMAETLPSQLGAIGFTSLLGHSLTHGDSSLGTRCFNTMLD
jgi:pentatricopeptide repeat protein